MTIAARMELEDAGAREAKAVTVGNTERVGPTVHLEPAAVALVLEETTPKSSSTHDSAE